MTAAGTQLTLAACEEITSPEPLQHLLHALNQPLTGLQCSLELAAAVPRTADQYVQTLREGLTLTGRMRDLVNVLREIVDLQSRDRRTVDSCSLDKIVCDSAADLRPVAEQQNIRMITNADGPVQVAGDRAHFEALMFRFLESALSLAQQDSDFHITVDAAQGDALIEVSWQDQHPSEGPALSRAELGLLVAETGWRKAGAAWARTRAGSVQKCTIRLPLASEPSTCKEERSK